VLKFKCKIPAPKGYYSYPPRHYSGAHLYEEDPKALHLTEQFWCINRICGRKKISVTGKVNSNINKEFRVKMYEAQSGITYPLLFLLLLLLLHFNNFYTIILFLDVISYYVFPVLSL